VALGSGAIECFWLSEMARMFRFERREGQIYAIMPVHLQIR